MTFRADDRGEPWRTNVQGLGHLLDLCSQAGIRQFHHVSTAYICGLREGRILESEIDVGQELGNVYEDSKLRAEKLLRQFGFDVLTVYRPASIIGDSQSGFTSNYHGFYLPLQLAAMLCGELPPEQMSDRFCACLGLSGEEGKNFVPVDWVAAAMSSLVTRPEHHGRTYHLAAPRTVSVRRVQQVVQEAIRRYSRRPVAAALANDIGVYEQQFVDQMTVYRSHWRDDPAFDLTNTRQALPHLPCPEVDHALLLRTAQYAMENNFGQRMYSPVLKRFDVQRHLARLAEPRAGGAAAAGQTVDFQVNGSGGGQWHLAVRDGALLGAGAGLGPDPAEAIYLNTHALAALVEGQCTVEQAIRAGRVVIHAAPARHQELIRVLRQLAGV